MHRSTFSFVMVLTACCCSVTAQVYEEYYPVEQPIYGEAIVNELFPGEIIQGFEMVEPQIIAEPPSVEAAQVEPIKWVTDYGQARRLADDKSRPALLFVTADGCHYCEMMDRDTFSDVRVAKTLKESFVAAKLKLDPDGELAEKLKITLYPTTIILNADGKVLEYARGYRDSRELHSRLQEIAAQETRIARK